MLDGNVLRLLWEKCAIGVCTVSAEGRFTEVNQTLCEILEYTPAELIGKHFKDVTAPQDQEADIEMAERIKRGELDHYLMTKTYIKKSGWPVQVDLVVYPVKHDDGTFEFYLSQIVPRVDIRETKNVHIDPVLVTAKLIKDNKRLIIGFFAFITALATALTTFVDHFIR